jgi:hypothetical protein
MLWREWNICNGERDGGTLTTPRLTKGELPGALDLGTKISRRNVKSGGWIELRLGCWGSDRDSMLKCHKTINPTIQPETSGLRPNSDRGPEAPGSESRGPLQAPKPPTFMLSLCSGRS